MKTPMQEVYENFNLMSDADFKAWMLNTDLLEEEKEAMTHDKILSMTDDFVQSNRGKGQIFADYHYDMMADFALHILETFNTKER
jgi:hypothetical protein